MDWEKIIPGGIGLLVFGLPTAYFLWLLWLSMASRHWPSTTARSRARGAIIFGILPE